MKSTYEMVIGLEVHVELKTRSKIFCGCSTQFGAQANTQVCHVCLGLPGALPVINKKVVDYAVVAGLACNCSIASFSKQDRKNYFYPDLPKAYQISQLELPICEHGFIEIELQGKSKKIGITRIHIEEDAGKLIHDQEGGSLIDYNRGGVPLIEIVSEPDIRSAEEAIAYLKKLRSIILYTEISDCKMNEGSFRCDVNLSIRKIGDTKLGTRTESKNLNSFVSISKSIEAELQRQIKLLETGVEVVQETRRWDQDKNKSFSMRTKEDAHDYRYFPDPDLMPMILTKNYIQSLQKMLPDLPDKRKKEYTKRYNLSSYDAQQIVENKYMANFFEKVVVESTSPKIAANILTMDVMKLLNEDEFTESAIPFTSSQFAQLVNLVDENVINHSIAKKVLDLMWKEAIAPLEIIDRENLRLLKDTKVLTDIIDTVISKNPKIVADYKGGKKKAIQSLMGQVMRETSGKAEPKITEEILFKRIE